MKCGRIIFKEKIMKNQQKHPGNSFLFFFFPLLVIATKEPGTEMTSLIQGISLIYLWGKLYEMKGNFPRTQPIALESFSAGEKQLHTER